MPTVISRKLACSNAYEVEGLSQDPRFVIVFHSLEEVAETGLWVGLPEKKRQKTCPRYATVWPSILGLGILGASDDFLGIALLTRN